VHFLKAAKAVHGDRYDYSKIGTVTKARQKITIICPVHGEFSQAVQNHIHQGSGCPQCGRKSRGEKNRISFEEFVKRARKIHGKKYLYIEASYTNLSSPVTIICPIHGEFCQNAEKHVIRGDACHQCGIESRKEKRRLSFAEFVKKAWKIHGTKYRYDEASYTDAKHPTVITCDIRGQFLQVPSDHLSGHGCRTCGYEKVSRALQYRKNPDKKGK
jgi:predicted nucleic-acid-binding Zn-ribbon protein